MAVLQEIKMKSTEFQPRGRYVLIKPDIISTEIKTDFGLVLSVQKSVIDRPVSGIVLAKGDECDIIEVGDYVIFPNTDGIDLKFEDSDPVAEMAQFMLLRYESIIGYKKRR